MAKKIEGIEIGTIGEFYEYIGPQYAQAGPFDGDVRMARLVAEAENWRLLYEAKSLECARLQHELEKRNG
jgi:hypothetical protein